MTTIILLGVFVFLIISNRSLARRIDDLELRMNGGMGMPEPQPAPAAIVPGAAQYAPPQSIQAAPAYIPATPIERGPGAGERFTAWLKEDWLMKLGAALFIIGFGWFVSYAFINNWIGPVGRISLGILAGVVLLALGFKRMMRYPAQGALFMALGAGMAMLTIFAGRSIYGFFTPATAVLFDFVIAAFVSYASYKFNTKTLAFVAQVLAFVTPLLAAGTTDSFFLFSYLLVVSLATLFLAGITGWRDLIVSSLVFVGLYSMPYIAAGTFYGGGMYGNDAPFILYFAYIFSFIYLLSGMVAVVKTGVKNASNEMLLAALNGLFLFVWIYQVAPPEWTVMVFAAWAVIFAISSFTAFRYSSELAPFYAYGAVAVAFIGAATSAELDGAALVVAFTLEVLLLVLSVLSLTRNTRATLSTSWLFVIPGVLSLQNAAAYARSSNLFSNDFFVLALLAASLIIVGRIITNLSRENKDSSESHFGGALVVFGTVYIGYTLWQFMHILLVRTPDMATMATLFVFTVFGILAYFAGLYGNDMARRTYGAALLGFVVLRLVLVDVWQMELFGRVVAFIAIGALLMSTAFLTKKKNNG